MKKRMFRCLALVYACVAFSTFGVGCAFGDNSSSSETSSEESSSIESTVENSSDSSEENTPANMYPEESLHFQKIAGKEEYRVAGIGNVSTTDIVIPSTYRGLPVTEIGPCAFGCEEGTYSNTTVAYIDSIVIPDSVTYIADGAFGACIGLTSITVPETVTRIGKDIFDVGDSGLTKMTIYCEAKSRPSGWHEDWMNGYEDDSCVVWDCKNNDVANDGYIYTVVDGIRYGIKDGVAMVAEQPSRSIPVVNIAPNITYKNENYVVTAIADYAFYYHGEYASFKNELCSIVIPNGVQSIGKYAFYGCDKLTSIVIGDNVQSIGKFAFVDCDKLTIYCEAESQPDGWSRNWNVEHHVVWGYKGE